MTVGVALVYLVAVICALMVGIAIGRGAAVNECHCDDCEEERP